MFMKRVIFCLSILLGGIITSCQSVDLDDEIPSGDYYKPVEIIISDPMTKAGESDIKDVMIFIRCSTNNGAFVDYDKVYVSSSSATLNLLFSSQINYRYSIEAYANMGKLDVRPQSKGQVVFSNESPDKFQMGPNSSAVISSTTESATLYLSRYVGKHSIVAFDISQINRLQADFSNVKLNSMWLACVPSDHYSSSVLLNPNYEHTATVYDELIYRKINKNFDSYGSIRFNDGELDFYAYGAPYIVAEIEMNGVRYYYKSMLNSSVNGHMKYNLRAYQEGGTSPKDAMPAISSIWGGTLQDTNIKYTTPQGYLIGDPGYAKIKAHGSGTITIGSGDVGLLIAKENELIWSTASGRSIAYNDGDVFLFRRLTALAKGSRVNTIQIRSNDGTGNCDLYGNAMSLVFGPDFSNQFDLTGYSNVFNGLFAGSTGLKSVYSSFLPATTLESGCYSTMFAGCTNLINAPNLSARKLANSCYRQMFQSCKSLTQPPIEFGYTQELQPACFDQMFYGCSSLTSAPELIAKVLPSRCYYQMFAHCTSLQQPPPNFGGLEMSSHSCYEMFMGCTSLGTTMDISDVEKFAPYCCQGMYSNCTALNAGCIIPNIEMADNCCSYMFMNCTNLIDSALHESVNLAPYCYQYMYSGCTRLRRSQALPATSLEAYCYRGMFYGCSSLTSAPVLPAKTLVSYCYQGMFQNCSKLTGIEAWFTTNPGTSYTLDWVAGVATSGTFTRSNGGWTNHYGNSSIPSGWSVVYTMN